MKKGVYVENLTEYHVRTVGDIVKLLLQVGLNGNFVFFFPSFHYERG